MSALSQKKQERMFLLDGMALAYRAYFSFISRPLINSRGENTSAIFGFVNTLMKILNDERPDHIAVVFDTKEPTFRHIMYGPYKATREKMPEDMSAQLDKLKEVVLAFNVPVVEVPGYEADDIMGTLARRAEKERILTFLVTGDKDFMQLISPLIKMYKPGKRGDEWEILDEKAVKEKFGVIPDRVIDVLGLIGDKSDNVPGVPGIGDKTAIPLVQEFGSIETILKHIGTIPQKGIQQKLQQHTDKALLSKKLVTIETHVPLHIDLHHLNARPPNTQALTKLFTELEFRSLVRKISSLPVEETKDHVTAFDVKDLELSDISSDKHSYHLVTSEKELTSLIKILKQHPVIVFDTETTSTDPLQAELVGLSFAVQPGEAWYIPVNSNQEQKKGGSKKKLVRSGNSHGELFSDENAFDEQSETTNLKPQTPNQQVGLSTDVVLSSLSPIFVNPNIKKIGQNIKYDALVLKAHDIEVRGIAFDTMVGNYILRPDGEHNLDALAATHLRYKMVSYDELTGTGKERKELRQVDVAKVADYSAEDADITYRLYEALREKLKTQNLLELGTEIEFPLIGVLTDMEFTGVALDLDYLGELSKDMESTLGQLTDNIYSLCGEHFNINSTQQLGKILFEKLQLRTGRKTKTGFSTDVSVLEELRHEHPVVEQLLNYRQLQKLKSTYIDALPTLINPRTGRVHTSFNQTVAATGRLSSSNPNLQNIPIRTEVGRSIRKAFVAGDPSMKMMSADYSQIELRIMAHVCGDEGLKEAFLNKEDIHATTASKVFGVGLESVTKDMRRKAKEVNFGIMYGIGPFGLASRLDITQTEAREIISTYFTRFPKVNQYISDTIASARRDGYVSTLRGRRRYLPEINSRNHNIRSNAERQAINMPIQGSAADMIKIAMINIHSRLRDNGMRTKMLLQVHDELVFETAKGEEQKAKSLVIDEMKKSLPLSVPVDVEVGTGKNWLEAH